jgi:hypothetical protein
VDGLISIPTNTMWGSFSPSFSPAFIVSLITYFDWVKWNHFDLHSFYGYELFFMYLLATCTSSFENCLLFSFNHFNRVICSLDIQLSELFLYFGHESLTRWIASKDNLPFCRLSLYSDHCFLWGFFVDILSIWSIY